MARQKSPQKKKQKPAKPGATKPAPSPDKFYRRIGADGWRNSNYFTYSSSSPAFRQWLAGELGAARRAILSIGCGNGEMESYLAGHKVVGIDLSHPMLRRALRAGLRYPIEADARFLPFGAGSFDIVIFPESIGHVPLPKVFAEARRVLKPRGRLIVTTYASHMGVQAQYRKYRFDQMEEAAAEAGFAVEQQRFLAASRNAIRDVDTDAKSTLLYFKARLPATTAARR